MYNTPLPEDGTRKPDSFTFIDGDTLVTVLPPVVDFHRVKQLQYDITCGDGHLPRKILLDFSTVEKLTATGISAIIGLGLAAAEQGITLLMLEPSPGIRGQLQPLLPAAAWLDGREHGAIPARSAPGGSPFRA